MIKKHHKVKKKKINKYFDLIILSSILTGLVISVFAVQKSQEFRNKAVAGGALLYLNPSSVNTSPEQTFVLTVNMNTQEKIVSAIDMLLTYDPSKLAVTNISTGEMLPQVLRKETSGNGNISMALGAVYAQPKKGTGNLASVTFKALSSGTSQIDFSSTTQVAAINYTDNMIESKSGTSVIVSSGLTLSPTISSVITPNPTTIQTLSPAQSPTGKSPTVSGIPSVTGSLSITPTGSLTPSPTILSPTPTADTSPIPTPTSIPQISLTPTNVPVNSPQIRFKAKLGQTQNNPEIYMKLRVEDELSIIQANINVNPSFGNNCNTPPMFTKDYYISMKADTDGVYSPIQKISPTPVAGTNLASVSPDGWVTLTDIQPDKYYTLILKGPKTRGKTAAKHKILKTNNDQSQDFDWSSNLLDPGDLPNPQNNQRQDCVINSLDLSLIIAAIGKTDEASLSVADVNYDGVVNGNDLSKVVNTLSDRQDDDF